MEETRGTYSKPEVVEEGIVRFEDVEKTAPELEGVPTGVEGLDEMFFISRLQGEEVIQEPLHGIPRYAVLNVTGVADTGKSILVEQFAITQAARGEAVCFVTVESPAPFLVMGMRQRATAMGVPEEVLEKNIVIIDAASTHLLRENIPSLLATLAHVIKTYRVKHTIVDSVTGFYEHKEMTARVVVRQLFNFLKKWHQTGLLVSQKRSGHEELSAEAAGGFAVAHILDGTLVLSKETIDSAYKARLYGLPVGEMVRLFRIDGCRLTGHDSRIHLMEITRSGLVKIGAALVEVASRRNT